MERRGFYPRGGGELRLHAAAQPGPLPPLRLAARGELVSITGAAFTAGRVAAAGGAVMVAAAQEALAGVGVRPQVSLAHESPARAVGDGCGLTLVATTTTGALLGASCTGERGVGPAEVGRRCGAALAAALAAGGAVDEHAADQLVIFMALAAGTSRLLAPAPLSLHCRTALAVAESLTAARFSAVEAGGSDGAGGVVGPGTVLLVCEGAGLVPQPE